MTTIAWDCRELAADSLSTRDTILIAKELIKINTMNSNIDGFHCKFWSLAGNNSEIVKIKRWIKNDCILADYPTLSDETIVIFVGNHPCALIFEGDCDGNYFTTIEPIAIGSGWQFSLAAMDFGKTAKESISYASTRDMATNNKIYSSADIICLDKNELR